MSLLPDTEQDSIARLILSTLDERKIAAESPNLPHLPIAQHPAIGIWADREDMEDSVEYVRALRVEQWSSHGKNHS